MGRFVASVLLISALACDGKHTRTFKMPSTAMVPTILANQRIEVADAKGRKPAPGDVITFKAPCDPDRIYVKRVIALAGDTVELRCEMLYVNGKAVPAKLVEGECTYDDPRDDGRVDKRTCTKFHETLGGREYDVLHQPARSGPPDRFDDPHDFPRVGDAVPSCARTFQTGGEPQPQQLGKLVETKSATSAGACEQQLHYVVPPDHVFVLGDNRPNSNDSRFWGSVPLSSIDGYLVRVK